MNWLTRKKYDKLVLEYCDSINEPKAKAYANDDDTFANFKNGGGIGLSKYQVWSVLFHKHIDAIFNAIMQNPLAPIERTENLLGRTADAINYLRILAVMLIEDNLIKLIDLGYKEPHYSEIQNVNEGAAGSYYSQFCKGDNGIKPYER
jgi:hypothetical protein